MVHWPSWSNVIHNLDISCLLSNIVDHNGPLKIHPHTVYIDIQTLKYTAASFYRVILKCRVNQFAVSRKITQSAQYGWESTIKRYSEKEPSRDSLLWRGRSHDLTAREGCHIGRRLWNYLGWHSLVFPYKILPQGAMRRLIIDVDMGKHMLISQYPTVG